MTTPALQLPELAANQSQPHVTVNAALRRLDALVQLNVLARVASVPQIGDSPPPSDGDRYLLTANDSPGLQHQIAFYSAGWQFVTPDEGWVVYVKAEALRLEFTGSSWITYAGGGGGGSLELHDNDSPPTETVTAVEEIIVGTGLILTEVSPGVAQLAASGASDVEFQVALSDMTTALTTGTTKAYFRAPCAFTLTAVRSSLATVSSSGLVTVDINEAGATILSTKLSIDASEKTSVTAATPAVISDTAIADDAELTFDIDAAGTGAAGLIVTLIGERV